MKILLAVIETFLFYVVTLNISYFAANAYKESFEVDESMTRTMKWYTNGILLKLFAMVSGLGNLLYKTIIFIDKTIIVNIFKKLRRKAVNIIVVTLDTFIFTALIFFVTSRFKEISEILKFDEIAYDVAYDIFDTDSILLIAVIKAGFYILDTILNFVFYSIVFGLLDSRIQDTWLSSQLKVLSEAIKLKLEEIESGLNQISLSNDIDNNREQVNHSISVRIRYCFFSILDSIISSIVNVVHKWVSWNSALVLFTTVAIPTVIVSLLSKSDEMQETILELLNEIISVEDILHTIIQLIVYIIAIKIIQKIVETKINNSSNVERRNRIINDCVRRGQTAEVRLETRCEENRNRDVIYHASTEADFDVRENNYTSNRETRHSNRSFNNEEWRNSRRTQPTSVREEQDNSNNNANNEDDQQIRSEINQDFKSRIEELENKIKQYKDIGQIQDTGFFKYIYNRAIMVSIDNSIPVEIYIAMQHQTNTGIDSLKQACNVAIIDSLKQACDVAMNNSNNDMIANLFLYAYLYENKGIVKFLLTNYESIISQVYTETLTGTNDNTNVYFRKMLAGLILCCNNEEIKNILSEKMESIF